MRAFTRHQVFNHDPAPQTQYLQEIKDYSILHMNILYVKQKCKKRHTDLWELKDALHRATCERQSDSSRWRHCSAALEDNCASKMLNLAMTLIKGSTVTQQLKTGSHSTITKTKKKSEYQGLELTTDRGDTEYNYGSTKSHKSLLWTITLASSMGHIHSFSPYKNHAKNYGWTCQSIMYISGHFYSPI